MSGQWTVIPDAYGTVRTLRGVEAARTASHVPASGDDIAAVLAVDPRGPQPDRPACTGMDPSIFFPEIGEKADDARAVCATCPARPHEACFTFALEHHERHGVWAGLTEEERRPLLRLLAIPRPRPVRCQNDLHDLTESSTGQSGRCKACSRTVHAARRRRRRAERVAA